ncbi:Hypothetical protein POVN_LOCUS416 [uncultured virus]|nr:Hypothetical protein POVN_LOCUS416 [uncultured virus]
MSLSKPRLTNLDRKGDGAWYALHLMCANAKTPEEKQACIYLIRLYRTKFLCERCQKHVDAFATVESPESYLNEPEGLFVWSWKAHNGANLAKDPTGKSQMNYEDAHTLYYGSSACKEDCGHDEKTAAHETKVPLTAAPVPGSTIVVKADAPAIPFLVGGLHASSSYNATAKTAGVSSIRLVGAA